MVSSSERALAEPASRRRLLPARETSNALGGKEFLLVESTGRAIVAVLGCFGGARNI
jgi:hypothetical protein